MFGPGATSAASLRNLLHRVHLEFLGKLSSETELLPDPYQKNTEYGCCHVVGEGGVLGSRCFDHSRLNVPHIFGNRDHLKLRRKQNL